MQHETHTTHQLAAWLIAGVVASFSAAEAAPLSLSNSPLYLTTPVAPNIVVTLDDSGSMTWGAVPDDIAGYGSSNQTVKNSRRWKSAYFNPIYYNPNVIYTRPVDATGTPLSTSFSTAYRNGFDPSRGSVNLSTSYRPMDVYAPSSDCSSTGNTTCHYADNPAVDFPGQTTAGVAAYYYVFDTSLINCSATSTDEDCYRKVTVSTTSGPGALDLNGDGTIDALDKDERQNFANWYSFYRTRNLMTVSGAALAFSTLSADVRVAWQNLHTCTSFGTNCQGWTSTNYDNRIRKFTGTHRTNFYNWLFRLPASGGTPLRSAVERAGNYFTTSGITSPYAYDPQVTAAPEYSCRGNYSVVMTDGMWNTDNISSYGNYDSTSRTLPDGTTFTAPKAPYSDANSNSLADIAFYFWANDLRPTLANDLAAYMPDQTGSATVQYWNPKNDPATWQHMVTFTVGLGLSSSFPLTTNSTLTWGGNTYAGSYANLLAGTAQWSSATGWDADNNVADLWHAAINSRGEFFSAEDPAALSSAFSSIVNHILSRTGSSSAVAANSTSSGTSTEIFQARFNSQRWDGELLSIPISGSGLGTATWNAGTLLANPSSSARTIITYSSTSRDGIPFQWSNLDTAAQAAIQGTDTATVAQQRLDYLRGNAANEGATATSFRQRPNTKLGDIVNSTPLYVGAPVGQYEDDRLYRAAYLSSASYATFRNTGTYANRTPIVYVGANDGMLHGFDANTGQERVAYVPRTVYGNLKSLSDQNYIHKYFVDGSPTAADVEISGSWRTVLVGGLSGGGKGIYALDISNPANFSESNAASLVLWEFSSGDDADLGYTYSKPMILKMNNGKWAAVFGNGYNNSNTGRAVLYILFIEDGIDGTWGSNDYVKLDTKVGSVATPNGLSSVNGIDFDGNGTVDYLYAGDLEGNVWKFDVTDGNKNNWKVAYGTTATPQPLYTTCTADPCTATNRQPITTRPELTFHPTNLNSMMVYVGTGRYVDTLDPSITQTQTMYGIWDNNAQVSGRNQLQQQTFTTTTVGTATYRIPSSTSMNWANKKGWFEDLPGIGERVVGTPTLTGGVLFYDTFVPSTNVCSYGGDGYLMAVNFENGGLPNLAVFDTNGDNNFTSADAIVGGVQTTGTVGGSRTVRTATTGGGSGGGGTGGGTGGGGGGQCSAQAIASDPTGTLRAKCINGGLFLGQRISWRELINE